MKVWYKVQYKFRVYIDICENGIYIVKMSDFDEFEGGDHLMMDLDGIKCEWGRLMRGIEWWWIEDDMEWGMRVEWWMEYTWEWYDIDIGWDGMTW